MVVIPDETPVTVPDVETVPTAVLLLLHAPPEGELDNTRAAPSQTLLNPLIVAGSALMVTDLVTMQPEGAV